MDPIKAMNELQQTLVGMSIEEAHQKFQIATDEKERLEMEQKDKLNQLRRKQQMTSTLSSQQDDNLRRHKSSSKKSSNTTIGNGKDHRPSFTTTKMQPATNGNDVSNKLSTKNPISINPISIDSYDEQQNQPTLFGGSMSQKKKNWVYVIEQLSGISCFTVTIRPRHESPSNKGITKSALMIPKLGELELAIQPIPQQDVTVVTLRERDNQEVLFHVEFPLVLATIDDDSSTSRSALQTEPNANSICIRLQSKCMLTDYGSGDSVSRLHKTDSQDIQKLCCRFCHQALLLSNEQQSEITKVFPLPNGYWDEITDYLICYDGQPVVDFTSASAEAKKGQALEDSGILVLHREDMDKSVCVLAVEGYGEESENMLNENTAKEDGKQQKEEKEEGNDSIMYRGSRAWTDAVGGATICCSQCCSVLGFASIESPDTFRLLKHRLSTTAKMTKVGETMLKEQDPFDIYSCSSFVVREMVRYAESKAIFTFVVVVRTDEGNHSQTNNKSPFEHSSANGKCLLLRILSWDTKLAISSKAVTNDRGADTPKFENVAKVIYEETVDQLQEDFGKKHTNNGDDPTSWKWGGVDLCCIPPTRSRSSNVTNPGAASKVDIKTTSSPEDGDNRDENPTTPASVRLYLSQDEWSELATALRAGSLHFSKAVADATILVKLGRVPNSLESVGLSA
eukprot:CAMPEP_0195309986 /NCGR_PEP_ID=MMETSP0707-20130614/39016_1 /TAXON_ID=33640 /ORGANISM="Asterionellopsis glacialis, Strain CCMP134" /LENGTH=679 /DNA_ID=CAMNT_0040374291 /DNA_START=247 /DNA_END=2283 /DNA_ORIENTATION=+